MKASFLFSLSILLSALSNLQGETVIISPQQAPSPYYYYNPYYTPYEPDNGPMRGPNSLDYYKYHGHRPQQRPYDPGAQYRY